MAVPWSRTMRMSSNYSIQIHWMIDCIYMGDYGNATVSNGFCMAWKLLVSPLRSGGAPLSPPMCLCLAALTRPQAGSHRDAGGRLAVLCALEVDLESGFSKAFKEVQSR